MNKTPSRSQVPITHVNKTPHATWLRLGLALVVIFAFGFSLPPGLPANVSALIPGAPQEAMAQASSAPMAAGSCNSYGCWERGGGCNSYGCWERGGGCNSYGCWRNGGGCNSYGCWHTPRGSCNSYGCSEVGTCNSYGCPQEGDRDRRRRR